jgi:hypothetical protein
VAGLGKHDQWREEALTRFRAEAAELLGVKDPPSRKETAPPEAVTIRNGPHPDMHAEPVSPPRPAGEPPAIAQQMHHGLRDLGSPGVRDPEALDRLSEAERRHWQRLWQEVEDLRQRAVGPPKTAAPARP